VLLNYGTYFYKVDTPYNKLRVDNERCRHVYNRTITCRALFVQNNLYLYNPVKQLCCTLVPDLPPTPPNWLKNSVSRGYGNYQNTNSTVWYHASEDELYYASVGGDLRQPNQPVAVMDSTGMGTAIEWNTFFDTMIPDELFALPSGSNYNCDSACSPDGPLYLDLDMPFIRHAMVHHETV